MRNEKKILLIFTWINQDLNAGSKLKTESFVSFCGDVLEREENVSEREKFIYPCVKLEGFLNVGKKEKMPVTSNPWFGLLV